MNIGVFVFILLVPQSQTLILRIDANKSIIILALSQVRPWINCLNKVGVCVSVCLWDRDAWTETKNYFQFLLSHSSF